MVRDLTDLGNYFFERADGVLASLTDALGPDDANAAGAAESLRKDLRRGYFELCYKTLIGHYKLVEDKIGYEAFAASLARADVQAHFQDRYPVLERWMASFERDWLRRTTDLFMRLRADLPCVAEAFWAGDAPGVLREVRAGAGDTHRGGQSVAALTFEDGRRLFYKPRSLSVDAHVGAVFAWIGEELSTPLLLPAFVDKGSYGWVDAVSYESCRDEGDVSRFYYRFGMIACMSHLLEGSDFHYENIIACGDQPVLVDLESFFHPRSPAFGTKANEEVTDSVLRSGLLPDRIEVGVGETAEGDISGAADVEGTDDIVERLLLTERDGKFVFERNVGKLRGAQNVPMLAGERCVITPERARRVAEGFEDAYRAVLGKMAAFRSLTTAFEDDEIRVLFRATVTYVHILEEALHPAIMMSEARLAKHMDQLSRVVDMFGVGHVLLRHELEDLNRRDVPLFTARAGSRDLIVDERRRIPDFFLMSGAEAVARRLDRADEADMRRQRWVIEHALSFGTPGPDAEAADAADARPHDGNAPRLDPFADEAARLAAYAVSRMHVDDQFASWLVVKPLDEENTAVRLDTAFYDLYGGMPGEILFLRALGTARDRPDWTEISGKAKANLMDRVDAGRDTIRQLGFLVGWGGVVHLLNHLAVLDPDGGHLDDLEAVYGMVDFEALIETDTDLALTKGSAGLILACAEHHRVSGSPMALDIARHAARRLLAVRTDEGPGYAWRIVSARPLSGMAHGASGFAAAFSRLHAAAPGEGFDEACAAALAYERSLFVPAASNWRDLRDYTARVGGPDCAMSWAHGAPGIGLARLSILADGTPVPGIEAEAELALATTLRGMEHGEPNLIAGEFGVLELPLRFAERYGRDAVPGLADALDGALDRLRDRTATINARATSPLGFMTGVSGIGYQCLRMAEPGRHASILSGDVEPTARAGAIPRSAAAADPALAPVA